MKIDLGYVVGIIGALVGIGSTLYSINRNKSKDKVDDNAILVGLNADIKYITKQLDKVEGKLTDIEGKFDITQQTLTSHGEQIKTLFTYYKELKRIIEEKNDG